MHILIRKVKFIFSILFIVIFINPISAQYSKDEFKNLQKSLSKTNVVTYDKFKQRLNISSKPCKFGTSNYLMLRSYFNIYQNGEISDIILEFDYYESNWLFVESLIFLVAEKNKEDKIFKFKLEQKNTDRTVTKQASTYERFTMFLDDEHKAFFNYLNLLEKNTPVQVKLYGRKGSRELISWSGKVNKMFQPLQTAYDSLTK